jgi:zinc protease
VPAIELILSTMGELRVTAPASDEVATTVDQLVNGFVFNFDSASQIVARSMYYLAQDLPLDWLERYLRGIQLVTPEAVLRVFSEQLHPDQMTILIVGDPTRMDPTRLAGLGPVTVLERR